MTYDQCLVGSVNPYTTDTSSRYPLSCNTACTQGPKQEIVYNPSNSQFSTQGAVSSVSRIERLKYNTIQTAAKHNSNWTKPITNQPSMCKQSIRGIRQKLVTCK